MSKTYLELVNEAIAETKVSLDPLTTSNFDTPPRTVLYNRFKTWVNRAYKELLLRRKEWQFRSERANLEIWPRLHLGNVAVIPSVGDTIQGNSSGTYAVVKGVHTYEDVENDGEQEVTLSLDVQDSRNLFDFITTEEVSITGPVLTPNIGNVKGDGTYSFKQEIPSLLNIDRDSIGFVNPDTGQVDARVVNVVNWETWLDRHYDILYHTGAPEAVAVAPDGNLVFYPKLNRNYLIQFNYSRVLPELVNWDDTPDEIPAEYQDYLMWKAVADYADWDSNQTIYARANKNLEQYLYWLERDNISDPYLGPNRFYRR